MIPNLASLVGQKLIDGRRVSIMSADRMAQRRSFALAAARAGFEVEQDFSKEAPIKFDFDKNIIGLRLQRRKDDDGCRMQTLIALCYHLVYQTADEPFSDAVDLTLKALDMAYLTLGKEMDVHG